MTVDVDVLVAGAGPAGLFTALYARQAGLSVAVVEPRPGPIDKACGEGLMPGALSALAEFGLRPGIEFPGQFFRGIRYLDGDYAVESFFPPDDEHVTADDDGRRVGFGVRRTELQAALLRRAREQGVEIVETAVSTVRQDSVAVAAAGRTARYLVAADGLHSPVRQLLGLQGPTAQHPRWGLRRHYRCRPWTDLVEVYWSRYAEAYVTPVGEQEIAVALLTGVRAGWAEQLSAFPSLAERLAGTSRADRADQPDRAAPPAWVAGAAPSRGDVRGAGPLRQRVRARTAGRVLLVGDAAGYVDALTGAGIDVAARCARELVHCLSTDRPQDYERAWRRTTRNYRWITGGLLAARRREPLRRRLVPAASRFPRVFDLAVGRLTR